MPFYVDGCWFCTFLWLKRRACRSAHVWLEIYLRCTLNVLWRSQWGESHREWLRHDFFKAAFQVKRRVRHDFTESLYILIECGCPLRGKNTACGALQGRNARVWMRMSHAWQETPDAGRAAQGRNARASNYTENNESFGSPQVVQDFLMSQEELAISFSASLAEASPCTVNPNSSRTDAVSGIGFGGVGSQGNY